MKQVFCGTNIREVWAHNLNQEMFVLDRVLRTHRRIAFDTEFPGFVYPSPRDASEVERYKALVSNVNSLKPIQLGLVLFDECGNIGGCWQVNFSDFDVSCDLHVTESISLLKRNGIDFEKNRKDGVDCETFAHSLNIVLPRYSGLEWVTFHGIYDVAYLSKILLKRDIPKNYVQFVRMVSNALSGVLYDVKYIADRVFGQGSIGLSRLGKIFCVERVGESHQAGSDSLMTAEIFIKIYQEGYTNIQNFLGGYLYGISLRFGSINNTHSIKLQRQQQQMYTIKKQCDVPTGFYWNPRQQYVVVNHCIPVISLVRI